MVCLLLQADAADKGTRAAAVGAVGQQAALPHALATPRRATARYATARYATPPCQRAADEQRMCSPERVWPGAGAGGSVRLAMLPWRCTAPRRQHWTLAVVVCVVLVCTAPSIVHGAKEGRCEVQVHVAGSG